MKFIFLLLVSVFLINVNITGVQMTPVSIIAANIKLYIHRVIKKMTFLVKSYYPIRYYVTTISILSTNYSLVT